MVNPKIEILCKRGILVNITAGLSFLFGSGSCYAAAVLSQPQSLSSGDTAASVAVTPPKSRSVTPRWSLPFDGSLKNSTTPSPVAATPPVEQEQKPPTETSASPDQPPMPSAVTLTPSAQASKAKSTTGATVDGAPLPGVANSANASGAEKGQTISTKPHRGYQVLHLTPPEVEGAPQPQSESKKLITGEVSTWEGTVNVDRIVNNLVDKTFENSPEGQKLDKQLRHLSSPSQKAIATTKDALNAGFSYQGFDPSERAGKLILDSNYKVRNKSWAEYERQKYVDKIHAQVVSSMMQMAEAFGMADGARSEQVLASAQQSLEALVGAGEASRTTAGLKLWLSHIPVPASSFNQVPWNTIERNKKLEEILAVALKQDPVVAEVTKKVENYAHPNKIKAGAARVTETTFNAISILGPGFAIPVGAEVLNGAFQQATGGSEESKLEKELLLDKRIQSRLKVLSLEATLALDNYRYALVTKNPPLLAFSQEVLGNMTGKSNLTKIVSAQINSGDMPDIVPEIKESKKN